MGGGNVPGRHTRSQRSNVTWQPTVVTVLEWSVGGEREREGKNEFTFCTEGRQQAADGEVTT